MAVKPDALGAHIGGAGLLGQLHQFGNCLLEFRREHVICVVAEICASQRNIGRIVTNLLPIAAQGFHPDISNVSAWQRGLEGFAIEMR